MTTCPLKGKRFRFVSVPDHDAAKPVAENRERRNLGQRSALRGGESPANVRGHEIAVRDERESAL
jgi:hypothetical protein